MIEQELKFLLEQDEYFHLLGYLRSASFHLITYTMRNHYFDTSSFTLLKTGVALRLRSRDDVWFFTYKCRIKGKLFEQHRNGALINEEYEEMIDNNLAEDILAGRKDLGDLPFEFMRQLERDLEVTKEFWKEVRCFGSMRVTRVKTTVMPYNIPLECDHVVYDDGAEEFEIESETDNLALAESVVQMIFRQNGLPVRPNSVPKIIRFLKRTFPDPDVLNEWQDS